VVNDVANNTLPVENYFTCEYRTDFQQMINRGYAVDYGEYVYSSTYDMGEWWSSKEIYPNAPLTVNAGNLHVAGSGPNAVLQVSVAGNSYLGSSRNVLVSINGNTLITQSLSAMNAAIITNNAVPLNNIIAAPTNISIADNFSNTNDRIVAGFYQLEIPAPLRFWRSF